MVKKKYKLLAHTEGLWEGGSACTSVRDPETQEGAHESLKNPKAFTLNVLFWFFHFGEGVFSTILVYLEK